MQYLIEKPIQPLNVFPEDSPKHYISLDKNLFPPAHLGGIGTGITAGTLAANLGMNMTYRVAAVLGGYACCFFAICVICHLKKCICNKQKPTTEKPEIKFMSSK